MYTLEIIKNITYSGEVYFQIGGNGIKKYKDLEEAKEAFNKIKATLTKESEIVYSEEI